MARQPSVFYQVSRHTNPVQILHRFSTAIAS